MLVPQHKYHQSPQCLFMIAPFVDMFTNELGHGLRLKQPERLQRGRGEQIVQHIAKLMPKPLIHRQGKPVLATLPGYRG